MRRYGEIYGGRFLMENEAALRNQIADIKATCFQEAEPVSVDEYVADMVCKHFCSRGYTAGDMAYVIPNEVFEAVRRGMPAYALYPGNQKKLIPSVEEADRLNMKGALFGIRPDDKKLLDYLVERPSMKGELFSNEELRKLYSILLQIGKTDALDEDGRNSLDCIIEKLDKVIARWPMGWMKCNALWSGTQKETWSPSLMDWNCEVMQPQRQKRVAMLNTVANILIRFFIWSFLPSVLQNISGLAVERGTQFCQSGNFQCLRFPVL